LAFLTTVAHKFPASFFGLLNVIIFYRMMSASYPSPSLEGQALILVFAALGMLAKA